MLTLMVSNIYDVWSVWMKRVITGLRGCRYLQNPEVSQACQVRIVDSCEVIPLQVPEKKCEVS